MARGRRKKEIDREFVDKLHREHVPLSGSIELTHRCNLACRHCYQFRPREGELEAGRWIETLNELVERGCLFLAFTGGEPLLKEGFRDILLAAAERSFYVTLQTNATLVDGGTARFLGSIPTLRVDVSVYGARPATHDFLTLEKGSFAATRRALELLRENGVPLMLKVVVGSFNLDEVEGIAELADELGAQAVFTSLIFPRNDRDPAPTELRLDDAGLERFMRFEMEHLPVYLSEAMDVPVESVVEYVQRCALSPVDPQTGSRRYCGAGRTVFAINPYGDVYPCVAFPFVLGNINKESYGSIWKNSRALLDLRSVEEEIPEVCGRCEMLSNCGLCRALTYQEKGDIMAVSEEKCRLTRAFLRVLQNA